MIQIAINENYIPSIARNDRGEWEIANGDDHHGVLILTGFGGENVITVQFSVMQNGETSAHVTHLCVDNPIRFWNASRKTGWDVDALAELLNEGIASLCDYPEQLEAN